MPPRKKPTSSVSKKPNQNQPPPLPSKFGIQHFFERHSQNPTPQPTSTVRVDRTRKRAAETSPSNASGSDEDVVVLRDVETNVAELDVRRGDVQITPSEHCIPVVDVDDEDSEERAEASPGVSGVKSDLKRFKFSPGMLIKQSQDDGGDEVTWKISPVNDRLQAVSKRMPDVIKVLADASRRSFSNLRHCSLNKDNPGATGDVKTEKRLSSPPAKAGDRSQMLVNNGVDIKKVDEVCTVENMSNVINRDSPFRTPPSLPYCHEKHSDDLTCNGASDPLGFRQHKKALLELLDQVEDVILVDESVRIDTAVLHEDVSPLTKPAVLSPDNDDKNDRPPCFLVLEVSEKRGHADLQSHKVLRLLNEQSGEERVVNLWDEWYFSVVSPGDTINVIGDFDEQGKCDVTRSCSLIIVHPDILISGTRVAASCSCRRRTVLDERIKCNEQSTAALLGTLLHQIFQAGLIKEILTINYLEEYTKVVLQKNAESLYACEVTERDIYKTLIEAVPKMFRWIADFRDSQGLNASDNVDFGSNGGLKKVTVTKVLDIEEMAWAPKYGLKGMIDASLHVKVQSNSIELNEKIVPLEFKTGKGTTGQTAMEHSAQVILYTLLMSERYLKKIDSGILYYLHTDKTQGIHVRRSDLVGLLMRRNELASNILTASITQQLPPMLQSPSMCRGCRHLDVCTIYHKVHGGSTENSGLGDLFDSRVDHLTKAHCSFLKRWDHLIDLEAKEAQNAKRYIWRSQNLENNLSTSCISSLVLDASNEHQSLQSSRDTRFIYHFVRQNLACIDTKSDNGESFSVAASSTNMLDCTLRVGDYVILSKECGPLPLASGIIKDISSHHVSVSLSKQLRIPGTKSTSKDLYQEVWRIDKDESSASFAIMRFNIVQLFLQTKQGSHLRKLIVDLDVPRFDCGFIASQDPAMSYVWSEQTLNNDQRRALLKILTAKDYALILGMPGTGKTTTLVHAVKALLMRGASILLTSYTNSAVDNLLIKLKAQGIDFLRIGRHESVHEEILDNCISARDDLSVEEITVRLAEVKVVGVTCLGITNPLLIKKSFDICIMDEAGQTTLPVSLGPLMFASTFVLVGDHYQLPPLVQSAEAQENGMGVSLFCRLSEAHPQAISALQSQYRMCQEIMQLSNALIYGNRLRCGSPEIASSRLEFSNLRLTSCWLRKALDRDRPVIFINTDMLPAFEVRDRKTVNNPTEASILALVTEELIDKGIQGHDIGIITPYNSQVNIIQNAVSTNSVEIHTIDKYQGRDKDCILVSFVRSSQKTVYTNSSLLGDWHRINVALTRAKKKLIMVGSCETLSEVPLLKLLLEEVKKQSGILNVTKKDLNHIGGELKRCSQLNPLACK
uniref:DNA replication ATP-dependent helicase/nuclease n=1 Tax=Kalanchoe fedtschenkoi TaxID=63787 RepID=A0A7N0U5B7_KALFE